MTINNGDNKFFRAHGGRIGPEEIINGEAANLFPPIARGAQTRGDIRIEGFCAKVCSDGADLAADACLLVAEPPEDESVSLLLFPAVKGEVTTDLISYIENYYQRDIPAGKAGLQLAARIGDEQLRFQVGQGAYSVSGDMSAYQRYPLDVAVNDHLWLPTTVGGQDGEPIQITDLKTERLEKLRSDGSLEEVYDYIIIHLARPLEKAHNDGVIPERMKVNPHWKAYGTSALTSRFTPGDLEVNVGNLARIAPTIRRRVNRLDQIFFPAPEYLNADIETGIGGVTVSVPVRKHWYSEKLDTGGSRSCSHQIKQGPHVVGTMEIFGVAGGRIRKLRETDDGTFTGDGIGAVSAEGLASWVSNYLPDTGTEWIIRYQAEHHYNENKSVENILGAVSRTETPVPGEWIRESRTHSIRVSPSTGNYGEVHNCTVTGKDVILVSNMDGWLPGTVQVAIRRSADGPWAICCEDRGAGILQSIGGGDITGTVISWYPPRVRLTTTGDEFDQNTSFGLFYKGGALSHAVIQVPLFQPLPLQIKTAMFLPLSERYHPIQPDGQVEIHLAKIYKNAEGALRTDTCTVTIKGTTHFAFTGSAAFAADGTDYDISVSMEPEEKGMVLRVPEELAESLVPLMETGTLWIYKGETYTRSEAGLVPTNTELSTIPLAAGDGGKIAFSSEWTASNEWGQLKRMDSLVDKGQLERAEYLPKTTVDFAEDIEPHTVRVERKKDDDTWETILTDNGTGALVGSGDVSGAVDYDGIVSYTKNTGAFVVMQFGDGLKNKALALRVTGTEITQKKVIEWKAPFALPTGAVEPASVVLNAYYEGDDAPWALTTDAHGVIHAPVGELGIAHNSQFPLDPHDPSVLWMDYLEYPNRHLLAVVSRIDGNNNRVSICISADGTDWVTTQRFTVAADKTPGQCVFCVDPKGGWDRILLVAGKYRFLSSDLGTTWTRFSGGADICPADAVFGFRQSYYNNVKFVFIDRNAHAPYAISFNSDDDYKKDGYTAQVTGAGSGKFSAIYEYDPEKYEIAVLRKSDGAVFTSRVGAVSNPSLHQRGTTGANAIGHVYDTHTKKHLVVCENGDLYQSNNGGDYEQRNAVPVAMGVCTGIGAAKRTVAVSTSAGWLYVTPDLGITWKAIPLAGHSVWFARDRIMGAKGYLCSLVEVVNRVLTDADGNAVATVGSMDFATGKGMMAQGPIPTEVRAGFSLTRKNFTEAPIHTSGAMPIPEGAWKVRATATDGTAFEAVESAGNWVGDGVSGSACRQTGFGSPVFTKPIRPDSLRFDVNYTIIQQPIFRHMDTRALPLSGMVPIFRKNDMAVISDRRRYVLADDVAADATVIRLETAAGFPPEIGDGVAMQIQDETVTVTAVADNNTCELTVTRGSAGTTPAVHAAGVDIWLRDANQERFVVSELRDGQVLPASDLRNAYSVGAPVSTAIEWGNLQAQVAGIFSQASWSNNWVAAADYTGSPAGGTFNHVDFPIVVVNKGAEKERWAIEITGTSPLRAKVRGEERGVVAETINLETTDVSPTNPNVNSPYFTIPKGGWGDGWQVGNVLRLDTIGPYGEAFAVQAINAGTSQRTKRDSATLLFCTDATV